MKRTPEPELMDDAEQAAAYAAADFSEGDARVVADVGEAFGALTGRWLDLGCGPGNIALRIVQAHPQVQVWAVDGAAEMMAPGQARAATLNGGDRVHWVQAVLPSTQLQGERFQGVVSNSFLHHLHDPQVLWQAVARHGAPGAAVYISDLRRPPTLEVLSDQVVRYASEAPPVLQADFRASLHAAFTVDEVREQLRVAGLADSLTVEPVMDRYLRVVGRLPLG